jgi:hypothetical protein
VQVGADCAGRIGLVRQDHVRSGAGSSSSPGNAQACRDVGEGRCMVGLSCGEDECQGSAVAVGREVDLRGQSAAGPADGVVGLFADWGPFLRAPAACW